MLTVQKSFYNLKTEEEEEGEEGEGGDAESPSFFFYF